jgi:protein-S-isoprenylcysteine O-methyltransferase Ste14
MDETSARLGVAALWVAWLLLWLVTSRNVKATSWREPAASQALHRVPLVLAAILLISAYPLPPVLTERFLPRAPALGLVGLIIVVAGLGFAVWARWHLGSNWSSSVTVKDQHELIRSGPYGYVRHPIYSGMLLGIVGTAVTFGEWRDVLALGLALLALIYKSRVEEKRMRETFPEYEQYRRETAALVPFVY